MNQKLRVFLAQYKEIISFGIVGLIVTGVNWVTYCALITSLHWGITTCNTIAWFVSVVAAFVLNKHFVFQSKCWSPHTVLHEAVLFFAGRVFSGFVEIGLVPVLMTLGITQSVFDVDGFVAKFFAEAIAMVISYFLSKYTVFYKHPDLSRSAVPPSQIEFHADDYGLFPAQSQRILDCRRHGVLNGISVMPNSPFLGECMAELPPVADGLQVAVHLNFMEGTSLCPQEDISRLTDGDGRFHVTFGKLLLASYLPGRHIWKAQLQREISAQIHAVLPYVGNRPLRIDGHAHYHMIPVVFDALMDVIREEDLSVSYIRIPKENLSIYFRNWSSLTGFRPINLVKVLVLNILAWRNTHKYTSIMQNLEKNVFLGVLFSGNMCHQNVSAILEDAKGFAAKQDMGLEVLAHPGGVYEASDITQLTHPDDITFLTSDARRLEADMFHFATDVSI